MPVTKCGRKEASCWYCPFSFLLSFLPPLLTLILTIGFILHDQQDKEEENVATWLFFLGPVSVGRKVLVSQN